MRKASTLKKLNHKPQAMQGCVKKIKIRKKQKSINQKGHFSKIYKRRLAERMGVKVEKLIHHSIKIFIL